MRNILFSLVFVLSSTALAQETPIAGDPPANTPSPADLEKAKDLFENGRTLFEEARYREAITAWTKVYELTGRSELLFNLANAHERLGEYAEAIDILNKYRAFAPPEEKGSLERRISNLDRLDRERREELAKKEAELEAAAAKNAAANTPERPPAPEEKGGVAVAVPIGLGIAALGVASVGVGIAMGASSASNRSKALDFCIDAEKPLCSVEADPFLDKHRKQATSADVLMVSGIVGVAVGTVLVVTAKRPGRSVSVGANSITFNTLF